MNKKYFIIVGFAVFFIGAYFASKYRGVPASSQIKTAVSAYSSKNFLALDKVVAKDSSLFLELATKCEAESALSDERTNESIQALKKELLAKTRDEDFSIQNPATRQFAEECYRTLYSKDARMKLSLQSVSVDNSTTLETGHTIYTISGTTFSGQKVNLLADAIITDDTVMFYSIVEK